MATVSKQVKTITRASRAFLPFRLLTVLVLIGGPVGCSSVWWGGEPSLTTTEVGAATGAAVGAGLGAIVGSTSGNAGEGLVLGALAGGVTGGLVGRELERQESEGMERREALHRQQEMIEQQRREVEELKRGTRDTAAVPRTYPVQPEQDSFARSEARAQFGRPYDDRAEVISGGKVYLNAPSRRSQAAVAYNENAYEPVGRNNRTRLAAASRSFGSTRTTPRIEERVPSAVRSEPVARRSERASAGRAASATTQPAAAVTGTLTPAPAAIELPPAELEEKEIAAVHEEPVAVAKPAVEAPSGQCSDAAEEASRAATASSDADKLFYLTRAIRLCPQNADYHVQIGKVYARIGRQQDAEFEFRQALDLDPANDDAAKQLGELNTPALAEHAAIDDEAEIPEAGL